jgi:AcrR family transcriptional regulator
MPYRRTEAIARRLASKREEIMMAAGAAAAEGGMAALQIAPVAQRAGIAAGTVYRYFPAKSDLVAALIAATAERDTSAIRKAASAAPGPLSALAAAIGVYAAGLAAQKRLAWAIIGEPAESEIDDARNAYRTALSNEFQTWLIPAIQNGHLPEQNAGVSASALLGVLVEGLIGPLAATSDDEAGHHEAVQNLTLLALRALGVPDARARGLVVQAVVLGAPAQNDSLLIRPLT